MDRAEEDETGRWPGAGTPGGLAVARYLTAPAGMAAQHWLIVDTLLDEQTRSLSGVSRPDLEVLLRHRLSARPGLPGSAPADPPGPPLAPFPLDRRLDQLVAWGVVVQWTGPSGDPVYQLTAAAAQLHQAVRRLGPDPAGPVLAAELARLTEATPGEPAVAAQAWSVLRTTLAAMTEAVAGWRAGLAAAQAGAADPARVAARQDPLRRDVDVWNTGVDRHCDAIAAPAARLLDAGPPAWRPAALHSLGAAVPEDRLSALLDDYRATLTGLLAWFGPGDNTARQLRRQLRDVVVPRGPWALTAGRGQLSRRTDLLALAGALERSATDDGAWSLWCAATGLFAARHLPHTSPQPAAPAGTASFWTAEPAPAIQSRLADGPAPAPETPAGPGPGPGAGAGTRSAAGARTADHVARLPDRSAARAAARAAAAAQQAAAEQTQEAIQARSGLRLSAWTGLDAGELDVLLSFLAVVAGARPGQDGSRTVRTPDGRWTVRAEPAPDDAPAAVIHTQAGQLVHPDLRLTITAALPAVAGSPR